MRTRHVALLPLAFLPAAFFACSGGGDTPPNTPDASEAGVEAADAPSVDESRPPPPDASVIQCALGTGNDPVGLCVPQKIVLQAQHYAAFDAKLGVAASWDSTTQAPDKGDGGAILHDVHDDLSYAASLARYHASSGKYGDTELTPRLDTDLIELAPLLEQELATPPSEYSGELYANLRAATAGLRFVNQNTDADKLDVVADAYARAIFKSHFFTLTASADGGVSDGVIGLPAGGSQVAYAPADVATAALALLDMAVRNPADADAKAWVGAARVSLDHIFNRGREATTGMYYRALVTSADPLHDAFDPAAAQPSDALMSDVQAVVVLTLIRAQELVKKNATPLIDVASYPFEANADTAIASMNGTPSLWDGPPAPTPPDPPSKTPGAYIEGYIPSTATKLSNKPLRANAFMLASLHRANIVSVSSFAYQINSLRAVVMSQLPPNATLFSVVPNQNAFFRAASQDFHLAVADAGASTDAGPEPRAASYRSAAVGDAIEGLTELLYGLP